MNVGTMSRTTPWVDDKYLMLLEGTLDRFRVVSHRPLLANFRCPLCGDSQKSRTRARGYLFSTSDGVMYKCHNCGASRNLRSFLREVSPHLYESYVMETMREQAAGNQSEAQSAPPEPSSTLFETDLHRLGSRVSDLPTDHPAREWWKSRSIPECRAHLARWVDPWCDTVERVLAPGKYGDKKSPVGRIAFPFVSKSGVVTSITARALDGEKPKYSSLRTSKSTDAVPFGDRDADYSRDVFVTEGPIDSLFLDNAVALGGVNHNFRVPNGVYVIDNEPRNEEVVRVMRRLVKDGERVVVWPRDFQHKDVNDAASAGVDVKAVVMNRIFSGLRAEIEINAWRSG